jgi:hypothetical protein
MWQSHAPAGARSCGLCVPAEFGTAWIEDVCIPPRRQVRREAGRAIMPGREAESEIV